MSRLIAPAEGASEDRSPVADGLRELAIAPDRLRGSINPMRRATKRTLEQLDGWLDEIRGLGIEGLVEKANRAFYQRRSAILHFHEDDDGVYADVKVRGDWTRVKIDGTDGREEVVQLLRNEYASAER